MTFTPQQPKKRVVKASETIKMGLEETPDPQAPRVARPVDELSRIERLIRVILLANL